MMRSIRSQAVLASLISVASTASFAAFPGEATYNAKCAMCHGAADTSSAGMAKIMGIKAAFDPKRRARFSFK